MDVATWSPVWNYTAIASTAADYIITMVCFTWGLHMAARNWTPLLLVFANRERTLQQTHRLQISWQKLFSHSALRDLGCVLCIFMLNELHDVFIFIVVIESFAFRYIFYFLRATKLCDDMLSGWSHVCQRDVQRAHPDEGSGLAFWQFNCCWGQRGAWMYASIIMVHI